MTTDELAKLTPEEKRIKIAEACGAHWDQCGINKCHILGDNILGVEGTSGSYLIIDLPDYLSDLNAMHPLEIEMFKDAASDRWTFYTANLCNVVDTDSIISATAAQRADAFLLTVG